jgi:hypothetical protein
MTRYFLRCYQDGRVEVCDSETGDANDAVTVFGPTSWDTASRKAHEMNGFSFLSRVRELDHAPVVACPDCERYRAALQRIANSASDVYIVCAANEALDTIGGNHA